MRSRHLGKLTTNSYTCRSKPSSSTLTGGASPFCVTVLMATAAQGLNMPRRGWGWDVGGINSPSGKDLPFPYTLMSPNRIQGVLLAYSSCAHIHFNSKLKRQCKERSDFCVRFCSFLRTVPFTN